MEVKNRIIEEAARILTHSGVKAVRMDDIANNLGISKRTIYEIIQDKNSLIDLGVKLVFEKEKEIDEGVALNSKNVIEAFVTYVELMPERMRTHGRLVEELKRFYPKIFDNSVKQRNYSLYMYLSQSIEQGVKEKLFIEETNIELTVLFFMDSMFGLFNRIDAYIPTNISIQEALKYNVLCFFRGIATPKGVEIVDKYLKTK